ncbi:MAG: hypothetical protein AABZ60_22550 [Planctomycetota bacterium]
MNTMLCVSKAGGYRDDLVKKLEQTGFQVVPSDPDPVKTIAEAKKMNPQVILIDFSGSHQDSKMARETGQKLAEEFRSTPLYLIGVEKKNIELTKVHLNKNKSLKIVEEKLLFNLIKMHIETSAPASSEKPATSAVPAPVQKPTKAPAKKAETLPLAQKESVKATEKNKDEKKIKPADNKEKATPEKKEKKTVDASSSGAKTEKESKKAPEVVAKKEKEQPQEKAPEKQKKPTEAKGKEESSGKSKSKK